MNEADSRLPAHVEVAGLIRRTQQLGGFAAVLKRGDPDAGAILIMLREKGGNSALYERAAALDGQRQWRLEREETPENKAEFEEFLARRQRQDPDLWLIELDVADSQRLVR